jgi:hypothetical protein
VKPKGIKAKDVDVSLSFYVCFLLIAKIKCIAVIDGDGLVAVEV